MNYKIRQYIETLNNQFKIVKNVSDEEQKSMLTKYLCVRVAGLLEAFIKAQISEYTNGRVPKEIERYISSKFKDITNLKCKKLREVLDSFSNDWAVEFDAYTANHEQQKNSLDSIITNRHNIAHGQVGNLSFLNMQQYYDDVKLIITKLDNIIK